MARYQPMAPRSAGWDYYPPGKIAAAFLESDAFVAGIRGPIGSGKSTACVMKLLRGVQKQRPGPDGIVRRRTAIVRNSYPELKTTTIKTWHQWLPAQIGHWVDQGPPSHRITQAGPDGKLAFDWEVIFIALDRPEDVRKLLSMELSDAWINEAREVPKAALDGLTGRVGRYPAKRDGGCTDPQIIMDTNPPDTDHWWARLSDFPSGDFAQKTADLEDDLRGLGSLRGDQRLYEFFAQPGGRAPGAENLENLPDGYYLKAMAGKSDEWIKVYVDADYGFVVEGRAVYPEYRDNLHCRPFQLNRALPLYVGIDFGLTPAAVIGQRTIMGAWRWHGELVTEDMGARRFGEYLGTWMRNTYRDFIFAGITGDPAGDARSQSDETTAFQVLRAAGIEARPAPTNDFTKRREAVAFYLNRILEGEPGLLIHPDCQRLRKAMAGGYHYRRVQVPGDERFHDVPDKNMHSHVAEAAQYLMLGAGEGNIVIRRDPATRPKRPAFAVSDYKMEW